MSLCHVSLWYTHAVNQGNALLPPQSTSSQHLDAIHSRLSKEAVEQWQRPDILGLLMAAYSLLIHPAALSLPSPRGNSAVVTPGSIDLRKSWRECLEAPTELKSFTFARLCLVPSLQAASYGPGPSLCDTREFLCSALSVFASQYIDVLSGSGDLPISRAKWLQDAEEDLSLRRSHQEQQRQFQAWSGARGVDIESVPANVDLLDRPDCMDDVVAFVVAVCLLGPCYAICFWSREESDEGGNIVEYLVPSRALRELDRQQEEDPSLQPSYVSFLAALARAEDDTHFDNGGSAVHRMLCSDSEAGRKSHVTWSFVFEDLRWYARELNPQNFASATNSMKTSATTTSSTSYYYAYDATAAETQGYSTQQSTDGSGGVSRTLELGEENTLILSSHLALLMNVCDSCPSARTAVLNTNLPIVGSDGVEVIGQDSALTILFTLSLTPVSPDVRGSIFACIAKILDTNGTNDEQCHSIRDAARKAWDMLDECGILPIHMFDQYPVFIGDEQKNANGLSFPPSSTSLVSALSLEKLSR